MKLGTSKTNVTRLQHTQLTPGEEIKNIHNSWYYISYPVKVDWKSFNRKITVISGFAGILPKKKTVNSDF